MMKKKTLTIVAAAVTALSLTACQKASSGSPDSRASAAGNGSDSLALPAKAQEPEEGEPPAINPEDVLDNDTTYELYNAYIDISNDLVGRLNDSLNRYFTYVDFDTEFRLLEEDGNYYDCYSVSGPQRNVTDAYELVNNKTDKDELDQAFLDMYPSISALIKALTDIYEYTDQKTFLEDNYAKSQEQHTALLSVLEEYYNTGEVFRTALLEVADELHQEDLEQMKADGYEVLYSLNMVIDLAQKIQSELYEEEVWDENILDMDLTKIQPLYDDFSSYVEAVASYAKNDEALNAEGFYSASLSMFVIHMNDAHSSISKVLEKVKAGEALSESDRMITIAGQCNLTAFSTGVSNMVSAYNSLISY